MEILKPTIKRGGYNQHDPYYQKYIYYKNKYFDIKNKLLRMI